MRPGRFDRKVAGRPDVRERKSAFMLRTNLFESDVDSAQIARTIAGFTGADLENLLNEVAIEAREREEDLSFV